MKNKMMIGIMTIALCFAGVSSFAQTKSHSKEKSCCTMKDCCMMKDGKMCCIKDGKTTPMEKDMTMKNGTVCKTNGECVMKDGKKMQMKNGDCMSMDGTMSACSAECKHDKDHKHSKKEEAAATYVCPMHPDVTSDKPGKCPKCGMDLVKKK